MNLGDTPEVIRQFVAKGGFRFPIGMDTDDVKRGAAAAKYGINGIPTNYLVDAQGKVVFRSISFNEAQIREALARLDVK